VELLPPLCVGEIVCLGIQETILLGSVDLRAHVVGPDGATGGENAGDHGRRGASVPFQRGAQNSFSSAASRNVSFWKNFAQLLFSEKSRGFPMILPSELGRKKSRSFEK
jgi:hypothetical protein